ncbi:transcriptional regulator with XRE-family HTH domain [Actinokineospora baliensis]|uniref:helix-turn-helix domain-containing protein n=1 Tax=Actinokineospora baliensis TaxID=547056 RepID=UPI00195600FD|nr:helix-turn-helix transcriptional regulator [Actinokineospora baliensis]MBM7774312.1 transcriptional regulator with XRE-family HTH domain [Actinokineospora baliensis]
MAPSRRRLTKLRRAAGHTQESLAAELLVARITVYRWEAGLTVPQATLLPDLAGVLGVSPIELDAALSADRVTAGAYVGQAPDEDVDHVVKALTAGARYFDGAVVDYFRRQLAASMAHDGTDGPRAALPGVLALMRSVEEHAGEVTIPVRKDLLAFGAQGAEFAGWLFRDSDDLERATYWYDRAMEWSQEAGDFGMQGYMLLKKSQMAYDARNAAKVASLAQAAQHLPWPVPAKVRAEVTQQEALGLAMIGEPLDLVHRKLDEAGAVLASDSGDDTDVPNAYFNDSTLQLRNASTLTEAGRPGEAATLFGDILATGTLSRRDAAYFFARRAAALALSGEPDEAAAVGMHSASEARTTRSQRTVNVLRDLQVSLTPWRGRPLVRDLRDAVHQVTAP